MNCEQCRSLWGAGARSMATDHLVHFINGEPNGLAECGLRRSGTKITGDPSSVTCPNCLDRPGYLREKVAQILDKVSHWNTTPAREGYNTACGSSSAALWFENLADVSCVRCLEIAIEQREPKIVKAKRRICLSAEEEE